MDNRNGRLLNQEEADVLRGQLGDTFGKICSVVPEKNMTKKQKETKQVSLKDNRSKLGKQLKTNRNQPCPCGSGKKFKKCCLLGSTTLRYRMLQACSKVDHDNERSKNQAAGIMINLCLKEVEKMVWGKSTIPEYTKAFKAVNQIWIEVAVELAAEGKGFIKPSGFRKFMDSKPGLAHIQFEVNETD